MGSKNGKKYTKPVYNCHFITKHFIKGESSHNYRAFKFKNF